MPFPLLATTSISSPLSSKNPLRQPTKSTRSSPTSLRLNTTTTTISCEQKQDNGSSSSSPVFDRRNVLLGLGGLYGATATMGKVANADGGPVQPPDLSTCVLATDTAANEAVYCCPPYSTANIIDFVPPSPDEPLRHRKPAHKLSSRDIEKYKLAVAKMKELDPKDPWNFMQQATIHCTFCNGAFFQVNYPDQLLQVHANFLFLPWHRFYLYFWERILGKLIDDPTFAIPYWNWDNPEGMFLPSIYTDKTSSLYNDNRNHDHYNALIDFNYKYGSPNPTPDQYPDVTNANLKRIENMYIEGLGKPSLFMGDPISAGETKEKRGSLETLHNLHHQWVGPEVKPFHDMGNFYTAARDTVFFGHHANLDRLWEIYRTLRGKKVEFNHPDWLDASFIFYDENRQVVKVKVRDCLNVENLAYTYAPEVFPWQGIGRRNRKEMLGKKQPAKQQIQLVPVSEFGPQPRPLDEPIRALVPRPKTSRSKQEKEDELEVLVIDNIEFDPANNIRFDVFISKPIEGLATPDYGEYAGQFSRIPHLHTKKGQHGNMAKLQVGITNLLDDIGAESSKNLVVTLVPMLGNVTIGAAFIELQESDL